MTLLLLFTASKTQAVTTVDYARFLSEVMPYVRDCPELIAENAIRNACIEFCDKSDWLMVDPEPLFAVEGRSQYRVIVDANTRLARIMNVWVDERPLRATTQAQLQRMYNGQWRSRTGDPMFFLQDTGTTRVTLVPAPDTTSDVANIETRVVIVPTRDSTRVDASLWERWVEQIAWGARARLNETVGQPYYDAASAIVLRAKFNAAVIEARRERYRDLVPARLAAVPTGKLWSRSYAR